MELKGSVKNGSWATSLEVSQWLREADGGSLHHAGNNEDEGTFKNLSFNFEVKSIGFEDGLYMRGGMV